MDFLTTHAHLPNDKDSCITSNNESIHTNQGDETPHSVQTTCPYPPPNSFNPSQSSPKAQNQLPRKICPYWYHSGKCTKPDEVCKYLHTLDPRNPHQTVAWKPRHSVEGCGLALCPWKDGRRGIKKEVSEAVSQTVSSSRVVVVEQQGNNSQKRKFPLRHPDAPLPEKKARVMLIDYDDDNEDSGEDGADKQVSSIDATCFFW